MTNGEALPKLMVVERKADNDKGNSKDVTIVLKPITRPSSYFPQRLK